jgi:hypothetical protein
MKLHTTISAACLLAACSGSPEHPPILDDNSPIQADGGSSLADSSSTHDGPRGDPPLHDGGQQVVDSSNNQDTGVVQMPTDASPDTAAAEAGVDSSSTADADPSEASSDSGNPDTGVVQLDAAQEAEASVDAGTDGSSTADAAPEAAACVPAVAQTTDATSANNCSQDSDCCTGACVPNVAANHCGGGVCVNECQHNAECATTGCCGLIGTCGAGQSDPFFWACMPYQQSLPGTQQSCKG